MIILFKIQLFDQKILKNECDLFFFRMQNNNSPLQK